MRIEETTMTEGKATRSLEATLPQILLLGDTTTTMNETIINGLYLITHSAGPMMTHIMNNTTLQSGKDTLASSHCLAAITLDPDGKAVDIPLKFVQLIVQKWTDFAPVRLPNLDYLLATHATVLLDHILTSLLIIEVVPFGKTTAPIRKDRSRPYEVSLHQMIHRHPIETLKDTIIVSTQ
jgi:hypothetical protein